MKLKRERESRIAHWYIQTTISLHRVEIQHKKTFNDIQYENNTISLPLQTDSVFQQHYFPLLKKNE